MAASDIYTNLGELLERDEKAKALFMKQPEHVQGDVLQHSFQVNSFRALQNCIRDQIG